MESEGIGVTSSMRPILMPPRASARSADCAPGPGVLVRLPPVARILMWRAVTPISLHRTATSWAACMAAWEIVEKIVKILEKVDGWFEVGGRVIL